LQGAGLFHVAMGAVLGIAAFGRTQEKLAGTAANATPPVIAPVAPTPIPAVPMPVTPVVSSVTPALSKGRAKIED
jgi:hypothetical protein